MSASFPKRSKISRAYTERAWGIDQAGQYTEAINSAFAQLSEDPLICRERTEFEPAVRIFPQGSHLIVYLVDDHSVVVVRVLHKSMDIMNQLIDV
ncbi:MAG: type II toxin-antitoxin system RelE/ParE family toxin [Lysobacterales bacterium]